MWDLVGLCGLVVGVALVAVGVPWCLSEREVTRRRLQEVASAAAATCDELRSGPRERVAVEARTPSRDMMYAPFSGQECIWYAIEIRETVGINSDHPETGDDRSGLYTFEIDEPGAYTLTSSGSPAELELHRQDNASLWLYETVALVAIIAGLVALPTAT